MNALPDPLLSKRLLHLIQENDGKLNWIQVVSEMGIKTEKHRYECLDSLRQLEVDGFIRSEVGDSGVRFWLVPRAS